MKTRPLWVEEIQKWERRPTTAETKYSKRSVYPYSIGTAKEIKVMECEEKYDKAMEKIDVCCFTTIDTECSRTEMKIPMNSECLCRDRQKILAPMRHKDEYYRSLPTFPRMVQRLGWQDANVNAKED